LGSLCLYKGMIFFLGGGERNDLENVMPFTAIPCILH